MPLLRSENPQEDVNTELLERLSLVGLSKVFSFPISSLCYICSGHSSDDTVLLYL
jgi:hypothetical protein